METCRLCHKWDGQMVKYSVRHNVHIECALKKWGPGFFKCLKSHALIYLPFLPIKDAGYEKEYLQELELRGLRNKD